MCVLKEIVFKCKIEKMFILESLKYYMKLELIVKMFDFELYWKQNGLSESGGYDLICEEYYFDCVWVWKLNIKVV